MPSGEVSNVCSPHVWRASVRTELQRGQQRFVVGLILKCRCGTDAFAVEFLRAHARADGGVDRLARGEAGEIVGFGCAVAVDVTAAVEAELVVRHLNAVGAAEELRIRAADQHAEAAHRGVEITDIQSGNRRPALVDQVGEIHVRRNIDLLLVAGVEGLARVEIDGARNTALDHVGGQILEHLDRAEQFGRHILEIERAATVRPKTCRGR